ncbi:BEL1-like homeodomain protein 1 [Olea europaea var. sylvestris]|uniref:BEL1-like homeodomain protein 1 n=1 Tax=Olea europaea var. sylvestris TaxID=158386 RepID=UPI000C1D6BC1|nr:BEL1-like homeodomain protein 1 [Olea europaea var. sylvestris]XP_022845749.1 BEL1-like homeodomain protein 1 [Olea europaea var. sylvestris]XP_022845756.1 BEL1-like homeodomain protein 1 [Olea europaea var. sylvestris]XP_022845765.1 BEL1-like homeodomain protein 1 [Olea europaea var. sylvestris]XP_022845774.1 BEL1-like homeodomain protein 1 [Olea europaea var. sylvestris]XP_022845782.1 BEL1-like homeodomain protein 1 [Olea europaea var. sylvestris]XP_022845789.1 BEL1-like homeodomain prot
MAAYFHGNSELQGGGDGLQTLILMNPGYVGYSDTQPPPPGGSNFVFLNSNNSGNSLNLPHAPPSQTQHFVGIPLQATTSTTVTSYQDTHPQQDLPALNGFLPRGQYNLYNPSMDLTEARDITRAQQGLSLSLSSQHPPGFGSFRPESDSPSRPLVTTKPSVRGEGIRVSRESPSSASGVSNGVTGMQSVLMSSKYLKAAQELLEEVVNVGKEVKTATESGKSTFGQAKITVGESSAAANSIGETSGKHSAELTTAEKQEIQMKKAKLVSMLDEVEQRYRQYHQQMKVVISMFEQVAGIDSAKTYTDLALQTISKQFRCLKDAILSQIRSASKSLGEEENLGGKVEGSRLKYVDNQIRQQKALQQLGMIHHNAWRPQRGLPERSVSVLRAWLFEHFLHPYPKDSDKLMLAKQTGLSRSQVSNWFINARVRLWKPMVEEMYTEEMKEHEKNGSEEKTSKGGKNGVSTSKSTAAPQENSPRNENQNKNFVAKQDNPINQSISTCSTSPADETFRNNQSGFNLIGTSEIESITRGRRKKPRSSAVPSTNMDSNSTDANNDQIAMKFVNEGQNRDGFTLMGAPTNLMGGFGLYPMGDIGRFGTEQFQAPYSGNGTVSLTLGLPHCENLSGTHQTFLPNHSIRGVEIKQTNTPTSVHSTSMFGNINIQDRKRLAEQLLPDFVT